jgi:hypothetical protein
MQMGEIYGNSFLTIAAASAASENDHILVRREQKWQSYDLDPRVVGIGPLSIHVRRLSHRLGTEVEGGDYGKVSTRAWIWQERLLSSRTVFYTPSALKFECHCTSAWEGFDDALAGNSWSAQLENDPHLSWPHLVQEYTKRDITYPSDRLLALEVVMKLIAKRTDWTPVYGLWKESLLRTLAWEARAKGESTTRGRMNPEYYAPTWSWASVNGPAVFSHITGTSFHNDPLQYVLDLQEIDKNTGLITVSGQFEPSTIKMSMKRQIPVGYSGLVQRGECGYQVKFGEEGTWYKFIADVHLEPFMGMVGGEEVSTTLRVAFDKPLRSEDWTSTCYCLLLAKRKLRCLTLLLGRSLRVPNAWERIGIIDTVVPGWFWRSGKTEICIA